MYRRFLAGAIVILALWSVLGASGSRLDQQPPVTIRNRQSPVAQPQSQPQPAAKPAAKPSAQPAPPETAPATDKPVRRGLPLAPATATAPGGGTRRVVDFEADAMQSLKIPGEENALSLSGKVIFYHNGATITCDSAVRYSEKRMECFRNVVINKQTTYVYGDRADYNGEINVANVYAPIIKIVDQDAVMYTYEFSFNTQKSIGTFGGGGTARQKDNLMESHRGYYHTDTRTLVCVDAVEMRNDDYRIKSDSLSYNMDTEVAEFYVPSLIWNRNGEILSADRGSYDRHVSTYHFTSEAYVINKEQELWADTLHYNSLTEDAELHRNIQIRDEGHHVISFGDYGLYWGKRQEAMLTLDPSALSFDPQQREDTLYVRSDSMFLYTVNRRDAETVKELSEENREASEELIVPQAKQSHVGHEHHPADSLAAGCDSLHASDPGLRHVERTVALADTVGEFRSAAENLDSGAGDNLSPKERRRIERERKRLEDEARKALKKSQKDAAKGKPAVEVRTTPAPAHSDSVARTAALRADSLAAATRADSLLKANNRQIDSLLTEGETGKQDSMVRVVRAYRNVKMFRTDFQAVCDSLVAFSMDSTAHMYINPVMWNGANQIKSDVVDIYSANQQLTKAVFTGTPIMSSEADSEHYNQIKGKTIEALFRENEIYRVNVDGNGQTLYYMSEEDSLGNVSLTGFLVVECAVIRFDIANREVEGITWITRPVFSVYPLDKIPADQPQELPGFVWEAHRKPSREEVFGRAIKSTRREAYEKMPKPEFPITDTIRKHLEEMERIGAWRDRNDVLTPQTLEFIRSLGY